MTWQHHCFESQLPYTTTISRSLRPWISADLLLIKRRLISAVTDSEPVEWVSLRAMSVAIAMEHHRDLDVAVGVYQEAIRAM